MNVTLAGALVLADSEAKMYSTLLATQHEGTDQQQLPANNLATKTVDTEAQPSGCSAGGNLHSQALVRQL